MKGEFVNSIGIWGQRHYNYLKRKSSTVINAMRLKGTIEKYDDIIDEIHSNAEVEAFRYGFRLAAVLLIESTA